MSLFFNPQYISNIQTPFVHINCVREVFVEAIQIRERQLHEHKHKLETSHNIIGTLP